MVTTKTRRGSAVIVFHEFEVGRKPVVGVWWDDVHGEWIPCSWTKSGFFRPQEDAQTDLDLNIFDFERRR